MRFPTIPQDEQSGIARLATVTDEQLEQLRVALAGAPVLLSRDAFLKGVPAIPGISPEDQEKIVSALTYLYGYISSGTYPLPDFVNDVCESLQERNVAADAVERVRQVLPVLLQIDTLRLRAKAVELQVEHARAFQSVRIFTDVRPVFAMDGTSNVESALVFHTLKLEYFEEDETKEFFLALDDRDLSLLRDALVRAGAKAQTLRDILFEKLKIKDFGVEPD